MPLFRVPAAALAFALTTVALPVAGQQLAGNARPSTAIRIPFEQMTLPNGLNVILSPDHTVRRVVAHVWYHVGSKTEIPGHTGLAHMFEHVMFTGSGHVPYGMHDRLTE